MGRSDHFRAFKVDQQRETQQQGCKQRGILSDCNISYKMVVCSSFLRDCGRPFALGAVRGRSGSRLSYAEGETTPYPLDATAIFVCADEGVTTDSTSGMQSFLFGM